jgi:hypothetical protein
MPALVRAPEKYVHLSAHASTVSFYLYFLYDTYLLTILYTELFRLSKNRYCHFVPKAYGCGIPKNMSGLPLWGVDINSLRKGENNE